MNSFCTGLSNSKNNPKFILQMRKLRCRYIKSYFLKTVQTIWWIWILVLTSKPTFLNSFICFSVIWYVNWAEMAETQSCEEVHNAMSSYCTRKWQVSLQNWPCSSFQQSGKNLTPKSKLLSYETWISEIAQITDWNEQWMYSFVKTSNMIPYLLLPSIVDRGWGLALSHSTLIMFNLYFTIPSEA